MDQYLELLKVSGPYRVILVTNALISTVLYPYLLYLFLYRTPKQISTCMRLNMLNTTTACYVLSIVLALWQPVSVIPLLAGFSTGPLLHLGDWITIYAYEVTIALILYLVNAYTMAYILLYSVLKPSSKIMRWMGSQRNTVIYHTVRVLFVIGLFICLIHYMHNSPDELSVMLDNLPRSQLQAFVSTVAKHEPSFASFSYVKWTKGLGIVYVAFLSNIVVAEAVIIARMIYKTTKEIRLTKKIVRPNTHKAQMMIFRTFLIKSIFFFVFFLMPLLITVLALIGAFHSHWPGLVMYAMFSLHTPLVYMDLIYLIRPYRRFTCALMIRTLNFLSFRCIKFNVDSEEGRHEQSSEQISYVRRKSTLVMRTVCEQIMENPKVHPTNGCLSAPA